MTLWCEWLYELDWGLCVNMGYGWGFVWQNVVIVSEYINNRCASLALSSLECSKCQKVRKGWAHACISFSSGNPDCSRHRRQCTQSQETRVCTKSSNSKMLDLLPHYHRLYCNSWGNSFTPGKSLRDVAIAVGCIWKGPIYVRESRGMEWNAQQNFSTSRT